MALQVEFDDRATTDERRVELLTLLREAADEVKMGSPCPKCKHIPFYAPHDEPLIEGHVYSRDGLQEIRITGYCEFCFDLITAEPDEEEPDYDDIYPRAGDIVGRRAEDGSIVVREFEEEEF